jgi:hypothetical protein
MAEKPEFGNTELINKQKALQRFVEGEPINGLTKHYRIEGLEEYAPDIYWINKMTIPNDIKFESRISELKEGK